MRRILARIRNHAGSVLQVVALTAVSAGVWLAEGMAAGLIAAGLACLAFSLALP